MKYATDFKDRLVRLVDALHDRVLLFKHRNEPYFHYYRAVIDKRAVKDPQEAVGGQWEKNGMVQLDRLKIHGLKPHHTLLDIGCGSLRGGRHFIQYLDKGNYVGIDISKEVLEAGHEVLKEHNLDNKEPTLLVASDLTLDYLGGRKFDYIHAQSVFSHMPQEDIEGYFSNLYKVMKPDTQFYASFFESQNETYYPVYRKQDFYFPFSMLEEMGRKYGLNVNRAEDAVRGRKQQLVRIVIA
jgi:cyclopropane fatty-acyl-phospholipid synthase-like methyltransferase